MKVRQEKFEEVLESQLRSAQQNQDLEESILGGSVREIGCLCKYISFIGHSSSQQMSEEESSNGLQHPTSCFMSSQHPEVTAGPTSPSQPFNYSFIYILFIHQVRESIISAALNRHCIRFCCSLNYQ